MKSYQELVEMAIEHNDDIKHCDICGVPFYPRHSRQKTCASEECKRKHHIKYVQEQYRENEEIREKHRIANRKWGKSRNKNRETAEEVEHKIEHIKKQEEFDKKIAEYGVRYGEVQKQKVLSSIPPIKTEL